MTIAWGEVRGTNQLHHSRQLIDHTFKGVVGPNNDTLYTKATVDVSQGPVTVYEAQYSDCISRMRYQSAGADAGCVWNGII